MGVQVYSDTIVYLYSISKHNYYKKKYYLQKISKKYLIKKMDLIVLIVNIER